MQTASEFTTRRWSHVGFDIMGSPEQRPQKLLNGAAIKVRIAFVSALALALGAWLAPRPVSTDLATPQERVAPLLEEQVQLREANRPFAGLQEAAERAKEYSVAILRSASQPVPGRTDYSEPAVGAPRVAGFGVFVSDTQVLTHSAALEGRSSVELLFGGVFRDARVVTFESATGLVLLETEPSARTRAKVAAESPAPATLAVAVGRADNADLAVPMFLTGADAGRYSIGTTNGSVLPGMPVFTLAGELLAIITPDGREMVKATSVRDAAERMLARASAGERQSSFGIAFQNVTGSLIDAFGPDGVVIADVLPGGPADAADVRVGDVLLALGGVPITGADGASHALSTATIGSMTTLRLRRGARVFDVPVTPAFLYEVVALAAAAVRTLSGPEARTVFSAATLDRSAIPPSARVISVNGRTVSTAAQVERQLRLSGKAVPVLLRHDNHQFFAVVAPAK